MATDIYLNDKVYPIRYSPDKLPDQAVINRHPQRAKALGDTQAFLDLAGFSVHPDDKPELPADCQALLEADNPTNCYYTSTEIKKFFADVIKMACRILEPPVRC